MKSLPVFAVIILCGTLAQASSFVSCGTGAANDEMSYGAGQELQISSGDDLYEGAVGGSWNLKLKTQPDWIGATDKIKATTSKNPNGDTVITIVVVNAKTASGPVGVKYVMTGLYDDEPTLEKFAVGGFAGGARVGQFTCVSAND